MDYPEELSEPFLKLEGMQVHWMKIRSEENSNNDFYLARWETLGKRRFYEPPEKPVQPSSFQLYRVVKN